MAVDFTRTFGKSSNDDNNNSNGGSNAQRPQATLWANIGYTVEVTGKDGPEKRFVSLPVGIPIDTIGHLATNARNQDYAEFQAARNNLLDQIVAAGAALSPGQDVTLNLEIQLRRVAEERAAVVMTDENVFALPADRKLVA